MRAGALILLVMLAGCESAPLADGGVDAGAARECVSHLRCRDGQRCAVGRVAEIAVERGERGLCADPASLIGGAPASFALRPGGRPLADRLCLAQGISPGTGRDALRARQVELLEASGARMIRLDFRWALIEPERGRFDFSAYDPVVDAADAAGIEILALLVFGVPWATTATESDEHFPPDDPADFARFAAEVVRRYSDRVTRYEIWNEPNGGYRFWKPTVHGDAAAFGALQALAAEAIRGECTSCVIYSAGLFFQEQVINGALEFTHDMLSARPDALVGIDVFAHHPYPLYPPESAPELDGTSRAFAGMDADLREVLALHDVALPLGATELGWPVYGSVDEAEQAILLSRAMLLGAALGWDPLCWFNVSDGPFHGSFPPEDDFGIYRYGSEDPAQPIDPKPARDALAWLAEIGAGAVIRGARSEPALHEPQEGRFALDFEGPAGAWTVMWSLTPRSVSIDETREVIDHLGRVIGSTPGMLALGPAPVFLR